MLEVGVIGYGGRVSNMAKRLGMFAVPYRVKAIADPRDIPQDDFLKDTVFYKAADDMLANEKLDGIMIGTRCYLHTEMACKAAAQHVPLFVEKPVAITLEQARQLQEAFKDFKEPTVVSFPLRLTPIVQTVKEVIASGKVGTIEHVVAVNDVPYGSTYYRNWYRNYDEMGGLFLQKATHDLDYIYYLLGQKPVVICAMNAQRVYGGDRPFDLMCRDCDDREQCPESPFNLFYQRYEGGEVSWGDHKCLFADGVKNEDFGHCIVRYEGGAQASYSQNFFARKNAGRRGARLYGYKGTIDFDWYKNKIDIHMHHSPRTETIDFSGGMSHFGGDRELVYDFLFAMRDGRPSRSSIDDGILSAVTCLRARESAETETFCEVKL